MPCMRLRLLALLVALIPPEALPQRVKQYNLWVCPHCERGVKVADVADLSCESGAADLAGINWPWVKKAMRNFLQSLDQRPEERKHLDEVDKLLALASAPVKGECYLGVIALGFFTYHFMQPEERLSFLQTTVFGGVTFQRAVPLSYWDVYLSGWPIFGLMAAAGEAIQQDLLASRSMGSTTLAGVGMTGIDLGHRDCCDFPGGPASEEDRRFMHALRQNLGGTSWLKAGADASAMAIAEPMRYLAESAYRKCSWGRATAYFAVAESLLTAESPVSEGVWNSTKAIVFLGEHNLDGCEPNMTVYHQMQSGWPFWQILGRLELRGLSEQAPQALGSAPSLGSPPVLPESLALKWRCLLQSRGLEELPDTEARGMLPGSEALPDWASCLRAGSGHAHVALSADLAQLDGLVATLQSAAAAANTSGKQLCFHVFAMPHQRDFASEGLRCAFGDDLRPLENASSLHSRGEGQNIWPLAFELLGRARLLLHSLDAELVWSEVGLEQTTTTSKGRKSVMIGEIDLSQSLRSDTGNLGAVHNFARFSLHKLLPGLDRVIYLDVDVVVKGDLCELFDVPMYTSAGAPGTVAAVPRSNQPLKTYVDVLKPAMPNWLPSEAPSFNAGVMLIDLERWRRRQVSKLVAEWVSHNARTRLWLHGSQPPLLLLFHDELVALPWFWNVDGLGHRLNYPKHVLREAKLLHWTGPLKPWRHHGVNRMLWEPHAREYCPKYSSREHTTTCRPDSWFC